jgi:hypothetical protein
MSVGRGFRRLWVVVSALCIGVCVAVGSCSGYKADHPKYCLRDGGACQEGYPPGYENHSDFWNDREFLESLKKEPLQPEPPPVPGRRPTFDREAYRRLRESEVRQRWSSWEEVEVPASMDWRQPALGALLGVAGAVLLYAVGAVVGWVIRGYRQG